jgi:hypothetical protein
MQAMGSKTEEVFMAVAVFYKNRLVGGSATLDSVSEMWAASVLITWAGETRFEVHSFPLITQFATREMAEYFAVEVGKTWVDSRM